MMRIAVIIGSAWSETASGAPALPNSDRAAVALGLARFGGEVRAYASDPDARCFARAAGIETVEAVSELEMLSVDVALVGRGGCAEEGDARPAQLAEASGAALVYDVIDVQPASDRLVVTRDLGRGARDILGVRGRAVLVVSDRAARGPYVSRHRIEAASAARGETLAGEGPSRVGWELAVPRVRLGDHASRVAGSAVERMNALFGVGGSAQNASSLVRGSARQCALQLLRYLGHHGFVASGPDAGLPGDAARDSALRPAERQRQHAAADTASIPVRAQRRPRPVGRGVPAIRGPFEIGVDR